MLISAVARIVGFCTRRPWPVIALALLAAAASAAYATTHFAITTDVNQLISPDLDWRKREAAYEKAFPGPFGTTLAVVEAPTSELAAQASAELVQRLSTQSNLFHSVRDLGGGEYFARYALLFQPADELGRTSQGLGRAGPLIEALSNDPSLRGLTRALSFGLIGVMSGQAKLDDLQRPLTMSADTLDNVFADKPATFSWRQMVTGRAPAAEEVRHFIEARPKLDYSALEPGRVSSDAIRHAVSDLDLANKYQARVRLTGSVPMADEEFATVQQGALVNGVATVIVVLIILWLALRSARIITAVFINLFVGLAITAAIGLLMVHALNMISVAFAVLFIGLGVDFGIQFAVRYRTERHEVGGLRPALESAATKIGAPLTLAAAAVAAGFLSFLPTHYRGVSELGQIAGMGMLIAYATSITLLPALLAVFNPPGEPAEIGYRMLAPVDRFLRLHRIPVIAGTGLVALLGAPLLYWLTFDFNPINLRSTSVESVSTFLDLRSDPNLGANAINVVKPSLKDAAAAAAELRKLPQVRRAITLQDLVPQDQERKVAMIQALRRQLEPILQKPAGAPPTDAQNVAALNGAADALIKTAGNADTPGAKAAKRLADDLTKLAKADKSLRDKAEMAFIPPLKTTLAGLRISLQAEPVDADHVPDEIKRQWLAADGRARVEVSPNGDPNDNETIRTFARTILAKYPDAVGTPVSILESGNTVVAAFFQAGAFALISIAILLWIVLRRFGDVLLTLVPLLLAGLVTLEICVLIGLPLNFANIIALPVLLGVGVAFKIYYIMAWRTGHTDLLQSALTRAVIWSALTTATAFGSLWLSSHPGTSSMGKLLALSLVCTLAAAVLFQPALMGAPREGAGGAGKSES